MTNGLSPAILARWSTNKAQVSQSLTETLLACIVHSSILTCCVFAAGRTRAPLGEFLEMSFLKQKLTMPVVKYSVLGLASCLWVFGLVDQLYSSASMMKYILLSLLMAAVAFI